MGTAPPALISAHELLPDPVPRADLAYAEVEGRRPVLDMPLADGFEGAVFVDEL